MSKNKVISIETIENEIKKYFPDTDFALLHRAYAFAEKAHEGQKRSSGDPYIVHPMQVADILAQMRLDIASIVTGLLHDTVEDTPVTQEDLVREFGQEVADLVDGVTKLSKITFRTNEEKQAENFRKMIIAMSKDIRVILVKLADRLANMRTLEFLPANKQKSISQETLDIYAPIANRLGISWIKTELEDLCLRYLHPDAYYKLAQKVAKTKMEREKYLEEVADILLEKLGDYDVKATVKGRAKHFYSIYKKMQTRDVEFDQVHDILAFRIIVDNITECYKALGVIHAMYKPVPGRIKDYIAMPKANSYQSLHTTVIGPYGERVEIQIRTEQMNQIADAGIAAHWQYKEDSHGIKPHGNVEWVNRLLEWQKDLSDPNEFLETVKIDLFDEDIFVFTPRGEVKQLSSGATPLDFAYAIHTDVGHKCIGSKVNGKIVPLKHRLKSGDTCEIITSATQSPSKDWLKIVRSSRAKAKIRAFIKQQERNRAKELGAELLDKKLRDYGRNLNRIEKSGELLKAARALNLKTVDEIFIALGYGRMTDQEILAELIPKEEFEAQQEVQKKEEDESFLKKVFRSARQRSESRNAISVADLDDVLIRFAKCCNPLPGDSIVGYISRGRGVTVHTANCPKAHDSDPARKIDVQWNIKNQKAKHNVKIRVLSLDQSGFLAIMSQIISGCGANIASLSARTTRDKKAICIFDVEVKDTDQLQRILSALESQKAVISVERTRS